MIILKIMLVIILLEAVAILVMGIIRTLIEKRNK